MPVLSQNHPPGMDECRQLLGFLFLLLLCGEDRDEDGLGPWGQLSAPRERAAQEPREPENVRAYSRLPGLWSYS